MSSTRVLVSDHKHLRGTRPTPNAQRLPMGHEERSVYTYDTGFHIKLLRQSNSASNAHQEP